MKSENTAFYSFDSQASVAKTIASSLENSVGGFRGCRLIYSTGQLSSPADSGVTLSLGEYSQLFRDYFKKSLKNDFVYIQCLSKSQSHSFFHLFKRHIIDNKVLKRPIIISAFAGVSFGELEGLMARSFADILLLNSKQDYDNYILLGKELGFNTDNALLYGLPQLTGVKPRQINAIKTVCFFEQVMMPSNYNERVYLLKELINYASAFPERKVLIKLRARPAEKTIHKQYFHFECLKKKLKLAVPENLEFTYEPANDLYQRIDLCLTVSSTVALETMARKIPTAIISDLGIRSDYLTNHYVGSGCLRTFKQLCNDEIPTPDMTWVENNIIIPSPENLAERIKSLSAQQLKEVLPLRRLPENLKTDAQPVYKRKLRKLLRDPVVFCCDARSKNLKAIGDFLLKRKMSR